MGEMLDEVRAYIAALPEEVTKAEVMRCPRCESLGIPGRGRMTGLLFSVHIGNCQGETLIGTEPEELRERWKAFWILPSLTPKSTLPCSPLSKKPKPQSPKRKEPNDQRNRKPIPPARASAER